VALKPDAPLRLEDLQETLRGRFQEKFPEAQFSFEPGDIVSRILNFGSPTPVEVAVTGPDFAASRTFATKVRTELAKIGTLRDLQYGQTLDYPAIQVNVNRQLAGQLGVTVDEVGRSFAAATSSSRFVAPNYWADPRTGIAFQVQVEVPQPRMTTLEDLRVVPVSNGSAAKPMLGDLARIENATIVGEYDRINGQRMVTLTANVAGEDLGRVLGRVQRAIAQAGEVPRGATVAVRGQIAAMSETFTNIAAGLVVAVVVIFLLLAANFESLRLAFVVVSTVPAVLAGVVLMLLLTGTTLNVQSFMGAIMAIGVAVANAILLVTFAEHSRRQGGSPLTTAIEAARARMRPVLMTSAAMIAGMVPMALALGEGAGATAPLGRAVIGGLAAATLTTLIVLPSVYSLVQQSASPASPSLDPTTPRATTEPTSDDYDHATDTPDSARAKARRAAPRDRRGRVRGERLETVGVADDDGGADHDRRRPRRAAAARCAIVSARRVDALSVGRDLLQGHGIRENDARRSWFDGANRRSHRRARGA
jgi:multidrug efflux pump subunit AcrB